jgi:hypothetical protein
VAIDLVAYDCTIYEYIEEEVGAGVIVLPLRYYSRYLDQLCQTITHEEVRPMEYRLPHQLLADVEDPYPPWSLAFLKLPLEN